MTEREVLAQARKLKESGMSRTMNHQNLILWGRAGVYPATKGGGGWGRRKDFARETMAEIFAADTTMDALRLTLAQVRTVRELALLLETSPDFTPENSAAEINRLTKAFAAQEFFAAGVVGWLRAKTLALRYLYGDEEFTQKRKFFATKDFELFVLALVAGFYAGYRVDAKGKLIKPADAPEPKEALEKFITADRA
jgi:hypothetical protein